MIPRYGSPPARDRRHVLRPGVYALLPKKGQVLVTRQDWPEPELQLPGGGIDPGESPLVALHREVWEETGWIISTPRRLGAFRRFAYMPEYDLWAEKLCTIYVARPVRALGAPPEPGHTAVWLRRNEAWRKLGNAGDRRFAARFLR
ncbi:NUDIX domain-containing protein [Rhodosalinus sp. FB01]|uniref:NUDIX domain-containing protein n=1 Tax=Rhodosalinus sp. FB01 TaxID=3239194 RepID=UPI003525EF1D